jgi:hypothetical protein
MNYRDFEIRFGPSEPVGTRLAVTAPSGEGQALFHPPPALERTSTLLPGLWRHLVPSIELPEPLSIREVGGALFRATFDGAIQSLLDQSLGSVVESGNGLRIKLVFDLSHQNSDYLQTLPWEFLYRTEIQEFLALSRYISIIRFLEFPRPLKPAVASSDLRVLLVAPQPLDQERLQVYEECEKIQKALVPLHNVEVLWLESKTIEGLRHALLAQEINVLHFAGSAIYDDETAEGSLIFENEAGTSDLVQGHDLALLLGNVPSLRLVFLNACDTAKTSGGGRINPFRSIAAVMVACGVPAVVGMQFPISDLAALHFSEVFYQRLSAGDPIDAAIRDGRQAAYIRDPDGMEWGTPVLYTRISDGVLFEIGKRGVQPRLTVFLCHSSTDKQHVRELYRRLTIDGFDVWLDEERILPGKVWEPEIIRALRSSHAVIICLSSNSVTKVGFVQKEIAIALDLLLQQPEDSIYLIPVKFEDCRTPDRLSHLQFVRIDVELGYSRLVTALRQRARDLGLG